MTDDNLPTGILVTYAELEQRRVYKDLLKTPGEENRKIEDDNMPSATITSYVNFMQRMAYDIRLKTKEKEKRKMEEIYKARNARSTIKSKLEPSLLELIAKAEEIFERTFIHTEIPDPGEKTLILGNGKMNWSDNYSGRVCIPIVDMEAMYPDPLGVEPEDGIVFGPEFKTFNTKGPHQIGDFCDVISINTIYPITSPRRFNELIPGLATTANKVYSVLKELNLLRDSYEKHSFLKIIDRERK